MSTYLRPNIQLFAAPAVEDDPENKGQQSNSEPGRDGNPADNEEELPKTKAELDALIANRLKREQKKWSKQQATPPASTPAAPDPAVTAAPLTQPQGPAVDNTELQNAQKELVAARAQLAAIKSGISPAAVEDAVLLAIHAAEKSGDDVDEDSVAEALKEVLKRHPEWKTDSGSQKPAGSGFRVGAGSKESPLAEDDKLSSIFGNVKK